ncbi:MAG TPA: hypothetical protein VMU02_09730 [bacterium]|nr:hypothetical protein [bacterium]
MRILTVAVAVALSVTLLGLEALAQGTQAPVAPNKPVKPTVAPGAQVAPVKFPKKPPVKSEEYYQMVAAQLENMSEHAKLLYHHAATRTEAALNHEVMQEHINDIGASLDATKKYFARVEDGMTAEEKTETKAIVDDIHKSLSAVDADLQALKTEMTAPAPKPANIKQEAASLHHDTQKVITGHQQMMQKYSIPEPLPPVYPQPKE